MIDTEMYQLISLGLGALLLLVTLLVLSTLGKINKTLEKLGSLESTPSDVRSEPAPEPTPTPEPVAVAPAAATEAQTGFEPVASQPAQAAAEPAPAQTEPAPAQTATEPAPTHAAGIESIPEGQPFERDGRWWFKRGLEILVYEEQTGQWKPEPNNPFTGSGTASASAPAAASPGGDAGAVTTQVPAQEAGFWKCPSCGAVNGATSASCRMCFAARP